MTVRGGGFGPKRPVGSGGVALSQRASERRRAVEAQQADQSAQEVHDRFEAAEVRARLRNKYDRIDRTLASTNDLARALHGPERASQVRSLLATLNESAERLQTELGELQQNARAVVGHLAQHGFAGDQLAEARPVLDELRAQMDRVRRRLGWIRRRRRAIEAGLHGVAPMGGFQVGRARSQLGSTAVALRQAARVGSATLRTGQRVTRFALGPAAAIDRHALGSYLAQVAPHNTASRLALALLGHERARRRLELGEASQIHDDARTGRLGGAALALAQLAESAPAGE